MEDQAAGGTDPTLDDEDSPGVERRLGAYLIATTVLRSRAASQSSSGEAGCSSLS
jgi:hypothetical protein